MRRRRRAIGILAMCAVLLAASVFLVRWVRGAQPQVCRLPDGSTLTLLGTTYGRHHRWLTPVRGQGLWAHLQWLLHPKSDVSKIETPTDTLVLWVQYKAARGKLFFEDQFCSRAEIVDEAGNRQIADAANYPNSDPQLAANIIPLILPTFPRRNGELTVRYYGIHPSYPRPDAVFHISNPAPGSYPHWTPDPLPITRTSGDLKVTLTGVTPADQFMQGKLFQSRNGIYSLHGFWAEKRCIGPTAIW
jgi:hypothetical protein